MATMRGLVAALVFLLSIPLALINPYLATIVWLLIFPVTWSLMRVQASLVNKGRDVELHGGT
jgi:hypothetical protein